jgi:predicted site-specific integrase-resolvase
MKLSNWAKEKGISYLTAYRWFKLGRIKNATQFPSGTIIVENNNCSNVKENIVIYCRVSNLSRKKELNYQIERCMIYCIAKGYNVSTIYKEIASGMNDNRKQLIKMFNNNPTRIVVENKDRLTRFGFNYLNLLLKKLNCTIEVINPSKEDEEDLIKDFVSIITSFCCRIYGLRRSKNKINKIKQIISKDSNG